MYDIGISEIAVTAKYEDTEQRSIKYDAEAAVRPSKCPNPGCVSTLLPNACTNLTIASQATTLQFIQKCTTPVIVKNRFKIEWKCIILGLRN